MRKELLNEKAPPGLITDARSPAAQMAEYDALPKETRRLLANAPFDISPHGLSKLPRSWQALAIEDTIKKLRSSWRS